MKRISQEFCIVSSLAFCLVSLLSVSCSSVVLQKLSLQHARSAADQAQARHASAQITEATKPQLLESYGKLPLSFEANQGQSDPTVKFISRGSGYTLFLTDTEAVLTLKKTGPDAAKTNPTIMRNLMPPAQRLRHERAEYTTLRMKLEGAHAKPLVSGLAQLQGKANYFIGHDPTTWQTNIPTYARVQYTEIYPGINVVYYGNQRQLEYDLVVQPGADPEQIRLAFEGTEDIRTDETGDLILKVDGGELRLKQPLVYQEVNGTRQPVAARYVVRKQETIAGLDVGVTVAAYDTKKPLIIDPVLSYSTYLGGTGDQAGTAIAVDGEGNAYVTGFTSSTDFPLAAPSQSTINGGFYDAFVTKFNPSGSALLYSTFLGGSGLDFGNGIAVDAEGNAYVTGNTTSVIDFPGTLGRKKDPGPSEAFVTRLGPDGTLIVSELLGGRGDEAGYGIAVDASGNIYVTGFTDSNNFGNCGNIKELGEGNACENGAAFVAKLDSDGAPIYITDLGGNDYDSGSGIAFDASGNAYVTGATASSDFSTVNPVQAVLGGLYDAFVAKLDATGAIVYSTYLGGSNDDSGSGIAVDGSGTVYVTGDTASSDFPTANPLQASFGGGDDAFLSKFDAAGSLIYSTYLGGSDDDYGTGIAVDGSGNAFLVGSTASSDFPTANAFQATKDGVSDSSATGSEPIVSPKKPVAPLSDAFVTKFDFTGSALVYSSFMGGNGEDFGTGIALDGSGGAYVAGQTLSSTFPTANPFQATKGGLSDAFVAKITEPSQPDLIMTAVTPDTSSVNQGGTLSVTDTVSNQGAASGAFRIGYHLSTDAIYGNGDDVVIPTVRVVTSLGAGASNTATTGLSIPSTAPGGTYHLCEMADSANQVAESNETDNTLCNGATVTLPSADLVMTAVSTATSVIAPGQTLLVSNSVNNQGGFPAGSFRIGFYLSANADGSTQDVMISTTRTLSSLAAGASSTGTTSLTVPSATPPNNYYLCAMADTLHQVAETDEGNNTRCTTSTLQVTLPDLTMTDVTSNATTATKGGTLSVTTTASNGGSASGAFRIAFRLSPNTIYGDSDDVVITVTRSVTSLAAGASNTGTTSLTIPGATPSGDYYVCTLADSLHQVSETDEGNNTLCSGAIVTVP